MGDSTKIEWTDMTWNPVRGCSRVSPGCENCYAERGGARGAGPGGPYDGLIRLGGPQGPRWTGVVALVRSKLDEPLRRRKPRRIFVNSMSDLFHEKLSNEDIAAVFGVMAAAPTHTFQILTKRASRMQEWFAWAEGKGPRRECDLSAKATLPDGAIPIGYDEDPWPLPNVWLGVSVEDQQRAEERIPALLSTPAAVRFISAEPLLGPLNLTGLDCFKPPVWKESLAGERKTYLDCLRGDGLRPSMYGVSIETQTPHLDWVIVGAESGPGARDFDAMWARSLVGQCHDTGVACFVKQMGPSPLHLGGYSVTDRKGGDMNEWPPDLRVREFPR